MAADFRINNLIAQGGSFTQIPTVNGTGVLLEGGSTTGSFLTTGAGDLRYALNSATGSFVTTGATGAFLTTGAADLRYVEFIDQPVFQTGNQTISGTKTFHSGLLVQNGNVGIGTLAPTAKLEVVGDSKISGNLTITNYNSGVDALDRFAIDGFNGRLFGVSDSVTGTIFSVNDAAGLPVIEVESNLTDKITMGTYGSNALVVNDTKVGIGTATPSGKLDVIGDTRLSGNLNIQTPNTATNSYSTLSILKHTNASNEGRALLRFGGDFGNSFNISHNGYTNQSQGVPVPEHAAFFEIFNQNGIFVGNANNVTNIYAQFSAVPDKRFSLYSTLNASLTNYERLSFKPQLSGSFLMMSEASGAGVYRNIEIQNGGSTRMTVTSAGGVGIGTTSPAGKLHVETPLTSTPGSTDSPIMLGQAGTTYGAIRLNTDGSFNIDSKVGSTWNTTPSLTILRASQNVGISTTTPNYKFSVKPNGGYSGQLGVGVYPGGGAAPALYLEDYNGTTAFKIGLDNSNTFKIKSPTNLDCFSSNGLDSIIYGNGTFVQAGNSTATIQAVQSKILLDTYSTNAIQFFVGTTGTERMRIVGDNGNVGINVANPLSKLTVNGNMLLGTGAVGAPGISLNSTDGYNTIGFGQPGGWFMGINAQSSNQSINITDANSSWPGTPRVTFLRGGNVGIGTTTPTEKLDVSGNVKISGSLSTTTLGVSGASVFNSSAAFAVRPTVNGTGVLLSGELATGAFLTTGVGDARYAFSSATGSFLTTGSGDVRYALSSATGAFVTTNATGSFLTTGVGDARYAFSSATGSFLTTGSGDVRYALSSATGAFVTTNATGSFLTATTANALYVELADQPVYQTGAQTISGLKTFHTGFLVQNGNVGIGTTTPTQKLDVVGGSARISGPNSTSLIIEKQGPSFGSAINFQITGVNGPSIQHTTAGDFVIGGSNSSTTQLAAGNSATLSLSAAANSIITFNTQGAERMRVSSGGSIGIGTTNPVKTLQLGDGSTTSPTVFLYASEISGNPEIRFATRTNYDTFSVSIFTSGDPDFLSIGGRVSTTTLSSSLNIYRSGSRVDIPNNGVGSIFNILGSTDVNSATIFLGSPSNDSTKNSRIVFGTSSRNEGKGGIFFTPNGSGSNRGNLDIVVDTNANASNVSTPTGSGVKGIRLNSLGNVGIGTIAPTANLEVAQSTIGDGTISIGASGTTVTGVGTQFLNTFKAGNTITASGQTLTISAVSSNTLMTTSVAVSGMAEAPYTLAGGSRFNVYGNGDVGVGTTAPTAKLSVNGGYNGVGFSVKNGTLTSFSITNNGGDATSTVTNGPFTLYGGTNRVIGTASGSISIPFANTFRVVAAIFNEGSKFQLMTNHGSNTAGTNSLEFVSNYAGSATTTSGSVNATISNSLDNVLKFSIAESINSSGLSSNLREVARFNGSGSLGIGTTTPSGTLHLRDITLAGSGSLSGSALNIEQTWNTSGTPTAIKLNVLDTLSNASSNLMDLQTSGISQFRVNKSGSFIKDSLEINTSAPGVGGVKPVLTLYRNGSGGDGSSILWKRDGGQELGDLRLLGSATLPTLAINLRNNYLAQTDVASFNLVGSNRSSILFGTPNGVSSSTLSIFNSSAAQNTTGIILGNMSTSANSNVDIRFHNYLGNPHAAIRGLYTAGGGNQIGGLGFLTANGGSLVEAMRITPTNNVGVGTTAPTANFEVVQPTVGVGTISIGDYGTTVTGVNTQFLNTFKAGDTITASGQTITISAVSSNTLMTTSLAVSGVSGAAYSLVGGSRFRVYGNGDMTLGSTSVVERTANIDGVNANRLLIAGNFGFGGGGYAVRSSTINSSSRLVVSSPNNSSATSAYLLGTDGLQRDKGLIYDNSGDYISLVNGSNSNNDSYTRRLTILNNGNVGIGTTTPTEKLDIIGNAKISASLSTNTLGVSGASVFNSSAAFTVRPTVNSSGVLLEGELSTGAFLTTGVADTRYVATGATGSFLTTGVGDARYAFSSATGSFLTATTANALYVELADQPVYQTGTQTISGLKTFADVLNLTTQATASNHAVRADRNFSAGAGLLGGGDLTSNRTFSVDTSAVVTTVGTQTIAGVKTFTERPTVNSSGVLLIGDSATGAFLTTGAADLRYVATGATGSFLTTGAANLQYVEFADLPVFQTGNQTISGVKTFATGLLVQGDIQATSITTSSITTNSATALSLQYAAAGHVAIHTNLNIVPAGGSISINNNTFLTSRGAANFRLGAADAAAPVAQTLSVQSVAAGMTNTAGANLTVTSSQGTGTGVGGSIIFQVAPAGSSGTSQNALIPRVIFPATSAGGVVIAFNALDSSNVALRSTGTTLDIVRADAGAFANLTAQNITAQGTITTNNFAIISNVNVAATTGEQIAFIASTTSNGTAANGFGTRISLRTESSTTANRDSGAIAAVWSDATDATRTSDLLLYNTLSGTLTECLRILGTNGNVGIGTATPSYKLTVNGGIYISAGNSLNLDTASSGVKTITASGNDIVIGGGAHIISGYGLWARGTRSTGIDAVGAGSDLQLITAGAEKVRVTTAGNVGIGTTTPSEKLEVSGGNAKINGVDSVSLTLNKSTSTNSSSLSFTTSGSTNATIQHAASGNFIIQGPNSYTTQVVAGNGGTLSLGTGSNGTIIFSINSSEAIRILTNGNVGIGTSTPTEKLEIGGNAKVSGHFSAATKSFLIPHPTKPTKQLQYACLEGPENGVYIRGKTNESVIILPDYWKELVDEDSVTVTVTPIGKFQQLFVASQTSESVEIGNVDGFYNYVIYGERKDVDKLQTEI